MAGGRQQDERAVAEQVVGGGERGDVQAGGGAELEGLPRGAGLMDALAQVAVRLGAELADLIPLGLRDHQAGVRKLTDPAHVVLVQMRDHRVGDVRGVVAGGREQPVQGLVLRDLELGQPVVYDPGQAARVVVGLGHRAAVLAGVEEHQPLVVLDDVDVDRQRRRPLLRGEQPQRQRPPVAMPVLGPDLHRARAQHGQSTDGARHDRTLGEPAPVRYRRDCHHGGGNAPPGRLWRPGATIDHGR